MAASSSAIEAGLAAARACWEGDDSIQSIAILRDLAMANPAHEDVITLLANVHRSGGYLDAAARVMFEWCQACDFASDASERAARFIQQCQRQPLAGRVCDAAIARGSVPPGMLALAGNIARELGEFDKARALYLTAVEQHVDLNSAYVLGALAHTTQYADDRHEDFERFRKGFADARLSPRARAATGFGLAKAYDDIGDYASAAAVLQTANAMVRSVLAWSVAGWDQFVDRRQSEVISRLRLTPKYEFNPVFVVGIPRSGTTLAASRLARSTSARDRGELRTLRFIANRLIDGNHLRDAGAVAEGRSLYEMHTRQDDAPAICYIDQDPLNFCHLQLIEAMFPNARIIHCTRQRRDVALSLWSHDFAHKDCAFAYDFGSIAHYASAHDRLVESFRRSLSLKVCQLDYETLVADPDRTLAALAEFIDAPLDDAGAFDVAPIVSSSVWQARQPIYTRSIDRWRNYAAHVPELKQLFAGRDD